MDGQEILDQFYALVGDEDVDETLALQLANMIKDQVDEDRPWEFRKVVDTSKSALSSDTWETAKALPATFSSPMDTIYVGDDPYHEVSFPELRSLKDIPNRFAIDHANGNYYLTGRVSGTKTISFWFLKTTTDIELDTSPSWPTRWHKLIPPMMAEMYPAIENMERGRSWDDKWLQVAARYLSAMRRWDNRLKLQASKYAPNYDASGDANRVDELS